MPASRPSPPIADSVAALELASPQETWPKCPQQRPFPLLPRSELVEDEHPRSCDFHVVGFDVLLAPVELDQPLLHRRILARCPPMTGANRFAAESRKSCGERGPRGPEPLLIGPISSGRVLGRNPRNRHFAHGAFSHVSSGSTLLRGCSRSRPRRKSDRSVPSLPRVRDCRWGNAPAAFVVLLASSLHSFGTKSLAFRSPDRGRSESRQGRL